MSLVLMSPVRAVLAAENSIPAQGATKVKMVNFFNSQTINYQGKCRIQQIDSGLNFEFRINAELQKPASPAVVFNFILEKIGQSNTPPTSIKVTAKDPSKAQVAVVESHGGMMLVPDPNDKTSQCTLDVNYNSRTKTHIGKATCVNVIAAEKSQSISRKYSVISNFNCPLMK